VSAGRWLVDIARRLGALLVLLGLLVGVPAALWILGGAYLPDTVPTWPQVTAALTGPDSGGVFYGFLVVVGWLAWARFAVSVAVEIPAHLRGVSAPPLPGLGSSQRLAGLLVAAVIGISVGPGLASAAPASAGPAVVAEQTVTVEQTTTAGRGPAVAEETPAVASAAGPRYTVQLRDTLGRIAATTLGDWTRYTEIYALNRGVEQLDGGQLTEARTIRPGWILILPADATTTAALATAGYAQVAVQSGDTLSEIAADEGLAGWQPMYEANVGRAQPGGDTLSDPDLIKPGWVLTVPESGAAAPPAGPAPAPPSTAHPAPVPPSSDGSGDGGPQDLPIPPPSSPTDAGTRPPTGNTEVTTSGERAIGAAQPQDASGGLAMTLAGGGALLAAGAGAALLVARRARFRRRRAGRTVAATPSALRATEAAVLAAAQTGAADFAAVDVALRALAVMTSKIPGARLPDVVAARLSGDRLGLRLRTAAISSPPAPWEVDDSGLWWSLDLRADSPVDPDRARIRLAPYPALVSVGEACGQRWLLDIESIGALRVTGPARRCEDFTRHLVAELAVNSWSDLLSVTTVGFGAEVVDLNPQRLRHATGIGVACRELQARLRDNLEVADVQQVNVLDGRLHSIAGDSWMPELLVVAGASAPDDGQLAELTAAIQAKCERSGVVVVLADGTDTAASAEAGGWRVTLTEDGHLMVPQLQLTVQARQLTAAHAADIAALMTFEREAGDTPIPPADGDAPWQVASDAAGALHEALTLPRDPDLPTELDAETAEMRAPWTPTVPGSVLPHATDVYTDAAPSTAEDLRALAPRAPQQLREHIEDNLDQLDRDLADWWDPNCERPRLSLLGPVIVRARRDEQAVTRSGLRGRCEEAIAYLAVHESGASGDELAAALRPDVEEPADARAYLYRVTAGARGWLGKDAETGQTHLSTAKRGPYQLRGVLVDAALFRALRCRSGVRGRDGLADLQAALELVTGPPFDQRRSGYDWLEGLDQTYVAMVCDVAHLVVTAALTAEDYETARMASETALRVAPTGEKGLLDAMWVAFRDGHEAEAEALVTRIVRANDGDDERDLHLSTAQTIDRARRDFRTRRAS